MGAIDISNRHNATTVVIGEQTEQTTSNHREYVEGEGGE